jgi:DNA-binding transcriptional ArsR family regulator
METRMDELSPVFERMSQYFSLLSEPMRIRILHAICSQERSVGEIIADTGATQTNVSRHLNAMYRAGVLSRRKQGSFVYYGVADHALTDLCRNVCTHITGELVDSRVNGSAPPPLLAGLMVAAGPSAPDSTKQLRSSDQQHSFRACPAAGCPDVSRESD